MNKISKNRIYLFDFDGTLVDSMPTYAATMLRILDENGVKYESDIIKTITPLGFRKTAEYFKDMGVALSVDKMVDAMNRYAIEEYTHNIPAKEGVQATLRAMKKKGYSLNVLTASPHLTLDPCLKRLGLWEIFDNIWSCDDFNTTKSDPEIYKMAAERIGADVEQIIFVDDNVNAVKTAKEAGMMAVGIYDESSAEYKEQFLSISDAYVHDFGELLKLSPKKKDKDRGARIGEAVGEFVIEVVLGITLPLIGFGILKLFGVDESMFDMDPDLLGFIGIIAFVAAGALIYFIARAVNKKRKSTKEK
ncbi:MAG: HAD family phosphatase [Clostridia bacterium]|nr:HAD family phosphatase [Clostridia bacterium]